MKKLNETNGKEDIKPRQKLKKKTQVDGHDDEASAKNPKSLEDLWGFTDDKFGTVNEDEYKKKLSLMNKADLQLVCIKVGLMPHDERARMTERLLKQFRIRAAALKTADIQMKPLPKHDESNAEIREWLARVGGNTLV